MAKKDTDKIKKSKQMRRRVAKRSKALFLVFLAGSCVLLGSVVLTVAVHGEEYSRKVMDQKASSNSTLSGLRGSITDRKGTVLAYSNRVYTLILDPVVFNQGSDEARTETMNALKRYFDIDPSEIAGRAKEKPDSQYERMTREIPAEKYESYMEEKNTLQDDRGVTVYNGIWFEEHSQRTYPFNTFAADVIGFAGEETGGEMGLEKQYDDVLTGVDGMNLSYVGEGKEAKKDIYEASDGYNVVTTIDYGVQSILEKKLESYNSVKQSANTAAIVYDPNSGEILGMASWPFYDLNDPRDEKAMEKLSKDQTEEMTDAEKLYSLWSNFCVSQSYEPGSTFKSVTVASALEEGKTHDGDEFYCKGYKEVDNLNIRCWMNSYGGHGTLDLEEALGDSCNVALMDIGFELGAERMVENQYAFGFGTRTGVDLPDESRGVLKEPETMEDSDIASNSFGQNLEVNMVQMVSAYGALLNGGNYYQPHIVKAITDKDGSTVKTINPTVVRKPVTKETSEYIRQYLKAGVEEYAVQYSKVEGYSMGGKTATAQKHPRDEKKWLVSVMSFAPAEDPSFILYVVIDEPEGTTGGEGDGMDSQELTHDIMEELLPYMGVKKTDTAEGENDEGSVEYGSSEDYSYEYEDSNLDDGVRSGVESGGNEDVSYSGEGYDGDGEESYKREEDGEDEDTEKDPG